MTQKIKKLYNFKYLKKNSPIFDHRLDVIDKHNEGTFETILGFWIFFPYPASLFFYFLAQNDVIPKVTSSNLCFSTQYIFFSDM